MDPLACLRELLQEFKSLSLQPSDQRDTDRLDELCEAYCEWKMSSGYPVDLEQLTIGEHDTLVSFFVLNAVNHLND